MPKVGPVLKRNSSAHPVLVQCLADAVMNWPISTALASLTLAAFSAVAVGWAVFDALREAFLLSGAQPALQAMLSVGHG